MNTKSNKNSAKGKLKSQSSSKTEEKPSAVQSNEQSIEEYANDVLKMDENKSEKYVRAFKKLDQDSSGQISKAEFREVLDHFNIGNAWTHEQMNDLYDKIDSDKSGKIDIKDFLNSLNQEHPNRDLLTIVNEVLHEQTPKNSTAQQGEYEETEEERKADRAAENWSTQEQRFKELGPKRYAIEVLGISESRFNKHMDVFRLMDIDDNGTISRKELDTVMDTYLSGSQLSRDEVSDFFSEIDENGDGTINQLEYLANLAKEHQNKELLGIIEQIYYNRHDILTGYQKQGKKKDMKFSSAQSSVSSSPVKARTAEPDTREQEYQKDPLKYSVDILKIPEDRYLKHMDVFRLVDIDNSGTLTKKELEAIMNTYSIGINLTKEDVKKFFSEIDMDRNGSISKFEFLTNLAKDHQNKELLGIVEQIYSKRKEILAAYQKQGKLKDMKFLSSQSSVRLSPSKSPTKEYKQQDTSENEISIVKTVQQETAKKSLRAGVPKQESELDEQTCEETFNLLDTNGDKRIDQKELRTAFANYKFEIEISENEIKAIYEHDNDENAINIPISFSDFKRLLKNPDSTVGAFFKKVIKQDRLAVGAEDKYTQRGENFETSKKNEANESNTINGKRKFMF